MTPATRRLAVRVLQALAVLLLAGFGARALRPWPRARRPPQAPPVSAVSASVAGGAHMATNGPGSERPLKVPTGSLPRLSCDAARAIIAEVHERFPAEPQRVAPEEWLELWADWFDPHGMWSVAPDSPLPEVMKSVAPDLLRELEAKPGTGPCAAAHTVGLAARHWLDELRGAFELARLNAKGGSWSRALFAVSEPAFQDDRVSMPGRDLAADLGARIGAFLEVAPGLGDAPADAAFARFFPDLGADGWAEVALAAAVRAYVPVMDPHGQWAPQEEEWSLFEGDPLDETQPKLWGSVVRTALGARIVDAPSLPLEIDDLVLRVDGLETAGLSVEQLEELARVEPPLGHADRRVTVLRGGSSVPIELSVSFADDANEEAPALASTRIHYADGSALVVPISEVSDRLGDALANAISDAREEEVPLGILLDLRGNGGGSTDGAAAAIGLFLPGAPSFPLIHRGVVQEVMRALEPEEGTSWDGPVAVLVDGYTASAAEMIAGAIDAYGRGPLLGQHTFGKGCVQEYFDDRSGQGVLRLTTLLVALPDGRPLQRVGLEPSLPLELPETDESESDLDGSPLGAAGPDVRRALAAAPAWPLHHDKLGPCDDKVVCRALGRLGSGAPARRGRAADSPATRSRRTARPRPVLGQAEHSGHGSIEFSEGRGAPPR
ncbi:MAG TPA: S41 family peptidase [Polyangiaceae bacterium]